MLLDMVEDRIEKPPAHVQTMLDRASDARAVHCSVPRACRINKHVEPLPVVHPEHRLHQMR